MERIIIADDDIKVRRGLLQLINWNAIGAEVVLTAKNGKEVADYLKDSGATIVISDIRMPIMNGLELAQFIVDHQLDVNVILLSGFAEFEYAQEALKLGVREYILKPMNRKKLDMLEQKVQNIIRQRASRAEFSTKLHNIEFKSKIRSALANSEVEVIENLINKDIAQTSLAEAKEYYLFFISLFHEFAHENGIEGIFLKNYVNEIADFTSKEACRHYTINCFTAICESRKKNRRTGVAFNIRTYIEMSYGKENLSTAMIAEYFGLSASYISTLFKSTFNVSITQYITDCRMQNASRLLKHTQLPINTISHKVGYSNLPYFHKTFKQYFKMSPALYRDKGGDKQHENQY